MKPFVEVLKRHSLVSGIILMFLLTWPLMLANAGLLPLQLPFPLSIMAGYGLIAASLIMTALTVGKSGVIALLKRYLIWHVSWKWYAAAFLLLPACILTGVLMNAAFTRTAIDFSGVMAHNIFGQTANLPVFIVPFFLVDLLTNGEEMGWRGYVLPRFQSRYSALISSLFVGVIWGLWHLPLFLGHWNPSSYLIFMVKMPVEAIFYTWLYNNTKGSLLLVSLMHSASNTAGVFLPVANTASANNLGALMFQVAVEILIAIAVTLLTGPDRLSRSQPKQVVTESLAAVPSTMPA
jgi:membrane protease YdiL (CAAX protease family)